MMALTSVLLATVALSLLVAPAVASATTITDLGEGYPVAMNANDQVVLGHLAINEELEEEFEKPWTVWSAGKLSSPFEPLNGEGEGKSETEDNKHHLQLESINDSGQIAGSSTINAAEERTTYHPVVYSGSGERRDVGVLQAEISFKEKELPGAGFATGIDNKGDVVGESEVNAGENNSERAFIAPGGSNPEVVGAADGRGDKDWFSAAYFINNSGLMFGEVSELEESEGADELVNPQFYLWPNASSAGTLLNFDELVQGHDLANDGSVIGYRDSQLYLRLPNGSETAVVGLSKPGGVNSSHEIVGAETVEGAEHAAVWQEGKLTDLNTLLPKDSGWVLQRAADVNDAGDIAGIGTYKGTSHAFLLNPGLVVTSNKDSKESTSAGSGVCASEEGGCTLRAAIETANAAKDSTPASITFDIPEVPAKTIVTISPTSPLPEITTPVHIDATTQPEAFKAGSRTIGAIIDGAEAEANGLSLGAGAAGSTVAGLQIQNFKGDGVLLGGENEQVADSVLTNDSTGVEVASNHDIVGSGEGLAGDIFFLDGRLGIEKYLTELAGKHVNDESFELGMDVFGGGVVMHKPSSGTQILGDYIGVHGPGFSEAEDKLEPDGLGSFNFAAKGFPIGVLIAPGKEGGINGVTIGGSGAAANVDSGTVFGLLATAGEGTSINGLSVLDTSFGTDTEGKALEPIGGLFGVFAAGTVNGLQIGATGQGDRFGGLLGGIALAGNEVASPAVQSDTFGSESNVGSTDKGIGLYMVFGVMLADVRGAEIGGTAAGQGNNFPGSVVALNMSGQHLANDAIVGNTIGSAPSTPFTTFEKAPSGYSTIFGLLDADIGLGGKPERVSAQNLTVEKNTIQGTMIGLANENINGMTMVGNTIENDAIGMLDSGSGGEQIQGNAFLNDGIGLLDVSEDPDPTEVKQAQINPADTSPSTRQTYLSESDEPLAFDGVDATTTAELSSTSANTSSLSGENNTIMGNRFGVDASGNPHPDEIPVLIGGDEHALRFGGTAPSQGNIVEDNRDAGLWIAGSAQHIPTVQVLGNTIYNNENFTGSLTGLPGLGIDLIYGNETSVFGPIGVDPQDPTQPDVGTNNLQNSPVLTSASSSGGQLTITGSLHGVASTNYLLEVFADENQNPFGAGEGQTPLERISLSTDASGNVGFTSTVAAPPAGYRFVSSTATTVPASGPGVTSEFSVNAPITTAGATTATTPPPTTTTTTPGTTTTPKGAISTTINASGSSATVSGSSVTLPVQASCSSATASPCTVTTSATVPAATAAAASVMASVANTKHKRSKRPVEIGSGAMTLASGTSETLHIKLTSQGLVLLRSHGSLAVTVTVTISGHGRTTVTHTLHLKLTFKKKAKTKAKPRSPH